MDDVIVIGGGVIGLSIAYELAGKGIRVSVLESGQFGREASWAGAGILPPGHLPSASTPESKLRALSCSLWLDLSADLRESTGIDNGYTNCGSLELAHSESSSELTQAAAFWQQEGVEAHLLDRPSLHDIEPNVNEHISAGLFLPQTSQVRNPRHLKALQVACSNRGVSLHSGTPVYRFNREGDAISSVETPNGPFSAKRYVVATGAWSELLLDGFGLQLEIEPVRGQIVLLSTPKKILSRVIEVGPRYLVPRPDGRILIGSTEEHVGFDKRNTAEAIAELIRFGTDLVPQLSSATFERSWAGLRPCPARALPFIGALPACENLLLAAGHFRAGLQMSPGTAVLIRQLLLDEQPAIDVEPFACGSEHSTVTM